LVFVENRIKGARKGAFLLLAHLPKVTSEIVGQNLPVCLDSRQGIATISEIAFGNQSRAFEKIL